MTASSVDPSPPDLDVSLAPRGSGHRRFRWVSQKRLLVGMLAVLVLAGVGVGAALLARRPASSASSAPTVTTSDQNVKVTTGTLKQTVSASGTVEPAEDSDLTFDVSGTVNAVDATVGEKVTKGQTLATINSTALADQVAADRATVTSDEDKLTTDQDDSAATSTIDSDESQITTDESQLSTAESNLADATLTATYSGTVAAVDLAVGDTVSGGASSGGASSTAASPSSSSASSDSSDTGSTSSGTSDGITVISTDTYTISTSVDDTEVSEVKVGDPVTITPSESSSSLTGTVASVSLIASSSSDSADDVATFPVVIDVTGTPSGIYPGATATTSIVTRQLDDVVEVPTAAISYADGQATVTEVVGGSHKTVDVTTGTSLNGETQITGGLKAGDEIVEQVTKFKTAGGSSRTLFGGTGASGKGTGTRGSFTGEGPPGGFGGAGSTGGGFGGAGSSGGGFSGLGSSGGSGS